MAISSVSGVGRLPSRPPAGSAPFLVRFATTRTGAWTPRGETTMTRAVETTDE